MGTYGASLSHLFMVPLKNDYFVPSYHSFGTGIQFGVDHSKIVPDV